MANEWKQLFSEYPILQMSFICQDVTMNLKGQRTYHHELTKIPAEGVEQFILVHVWRGNNTANERFFEKVELIEPDGLVLIAYQTEFFVVYGPTYRQYNLFAFARFVFQKKGIYALRSQLCKYEGDSSPLIHEDYFVVE